jgi:hypothetical protein
VLQLAAVLGVVVFRLYLGVSVVYYRTWKRVMSETTFRGLEIWDLGIMARVGVRKLGKEGAGLEQSRGMGARAQ